MAAERSRRSRAEPEAEREVVITRVFDAPAKLLFEAYSKPEHVQQWFGPRGFSLPLCQMDFRVGGSYRFGMRAPDGTDLAPFGGEYLEIVPNEKIVYTSGFDADDKFVVTVSLDERNGRTTMTIHTLFATIAQRDQHVGRGYVAGVGEGLDRMEEYVR